MFRWRDAWVAALLTLAACTEEGAEAPAPADTQELDAHVHDEPDVGPSVPEMLPPPEAGPVVDAAGNDAGILAVADSGPVVDAALTLEETGARTLDFGAANACSDGREPLAANIKLSEIAIYQSVKIPLFKNGAWITNRNAPVVQDKKAFVRVFVEPQAGFVPHTLRAVLALGNGAQTTVLTSERNVSRASSDEASNSTFDFSIDGALIGADTRFTVALLETACVQTNASAARAPTTGSQPLSADATGKFRVVIVPVSYGGRTPDTGNVQLERLRSELGAYYPVAEVEVSVRAPIGWSRELTSDGTGWTDLLMQIQRVRQEDSAAANVYYFGWVLPKATFRDYCRYGCVLGLAPQTTTVSRSNQIGLGVGFIDENTYTTVVHELGHAQGLPHAPCAPKGAQIDAVDAKFPYEGGTIGVWGWDVRSAKLLAPGDYRDVMSYCEPTWISDHNFNKLATRTKAVNSAISVSTSNKQARGSWRGLVLYRDGSARWSGVSTHERPGELSAARALDLQGRVLSELSVVRISLSNDSESILYVPELDASWSALDLGDRILSLSEIAPPL
jgi:hypothetical protein